MWDFTETELLAFRDAVENNEDYQFDNGVYMSPGCVGDDLIYIVFHGMTIVGDNIEIEISYRTGSYGWIRLFNGDRLSGIVEGRVTELIKFRPGSRIRDIQRLPPEDE